MRILVTGGAGYVGSVTVRRLLEAGHDVCVLDSLERGHHAAVDRAARLVIGSVGDVAAVDTALERCDAVIHCAGLIEVAESQERPSAYWRANVAEPLVLLDRMVARGVESLVFSSTAAVYGEPSVTPIPETAPLVPVNTYGDTKLAFERAIDTYGRAHPLRAVRLRYFNVAGACPDGSLGEAHDPETHIVPRILGRLATGETRFDVYGGDYETRDGTCVRDYLHVWDLAGAHLLAAEHLAGGGEGAVFNLGSGEGYTNLEVVRACAEVTGREIDVTIGPRRQGDPAMLVASTDRARSELGWTPERAALETMIADAWRWHESHPMGYHSQ